MKYALVIDLGTEDTFTKTVETLNRDHHTNFRILGFREDVEVTVADIEVPEGEEMHLFTLGYNTGLNGSEN